MDNRMFLIEKGKIVVLRDEENREVSFGTMEEFIQYYPSGTFVTDKSYVDYEPARMIHIDGDENMFETKPFVENYELAIQAIPTLLSRKADPFYGLSDLDIVKQIRIEQIKGETLETINAIMPDWRQATWKEFMRIHEKKISGSSLTELDQLTLTTFVEPGETEDSDYQACVAVFTWIQECIAACNHAARIVIEMTDPNQIINYKINFPILGV